MKFKLLAKTAALVKNLLGLEEIPVAEGKVNFNEEQNSKLEETLGEGDAKNVIDAFNKEIAQLQKIEQENEELQKANEEISAAKAEVKKLLDDTSLSEEEKKELLENKDGSDGDLKAHLNLLEAKQKKQNDLIAKLISDPEGDSPEAIIQKAAQGKNMKHSATHLFASGKQYDAFEKRPWNQKLRNGLSASTDFNKEGNIPTLQNDLEHFVRENPQVLDSFFDDFEDLPKEWDRRTGVLDQIADGGIIPAEIVQGRKKGWSPKNNFKIVAEIGKVFRKKIDITFDGYELQKIENTWIRNYNKEGSHPWKMSFIGFLLIELIKQQKLDDRIAQINGIFAESPEGDGNPGRNVNSQDGIRFLWWYYRDVEKKYRPFVSPLGEPTPSNIVDYVKGFIMHIPEEDRNKPGMELEMSSEMIQWYRDKAGTIYQLHKSADEGKMQYGYDHPIDFPNWKFQELKDMTRTKFIGATRSKNVQVMDYKADEKGKFTIQHYRRDTDIFADYRLGIRFIYVGIKTLPGDPKEFEKQFVWSNDMPIFDESVNVPVFDDESGIVKFHYKNMKLDKDFTTNIEAIEGVKPGQVIKITGDKSITGGKSIKNNDQLLLTADFPMDNGGTLTLYAQNDGKFKELKRTNAPETTASETVKEFTETTIDATEVKEFYFAGAANATLEEILNGVAYKSIKIYGTDTADVTFTVQNVADNVSVAENAVLASKADFIELIKIDGIWTEVNRAIV